MRTTLAIDDDVLAAAKGLAAQQRKTIGEVISELARHALQPSATAPLTRNGIMLLPRCADAVPVTPELVRQLRDELA